MSVEFITPNKVIDGYSNPGTGQFAIDTGKPGDELNWQSCRDGFATQFLETTPAFFFSHPHGEANRVAEFIAKTEEIIDLKTVPAGENNAMRLGTYLPTQFALTNRNFIMWIRPSNFWTQCHLRRSLFTILVRCGQYYTPDKPNYDAALFNGKGGSGVYLDGTRLATQRFLFGFTKYVLPSGGSQAGWNATFRNKSTVAQVKKDLIWPDHTPKPEATAVGVDSIWM